MSTELRIGTTPLGKGIARLDLEGHLDWANYPQVEDALARLFEGRTWRLVINLGNVDYISSAGFGCFIGALDTVRRHQGNLVFLATPPKIREVFTILGLSAILTFAETDEEAMGLVAPASV